MDHSRRRHRASASPRASARSSAGASAGSRPPPTRCSSSRAVVGRNFDLAVLDHLVDLDRDDLLDALDEAVEAQRRHRDRRRALHVLARARALRAVRRAAPDPSGPPPRARRRGAVARVRRCARAAPRRARVPLRAQHRHRRRQQGDRVLAARGRPGARRSSPSTTRSPWFQQARDLIEDGGGDPGQLAPRAHGARASRRSTPGCPTFRDTLLAAAARAEKDGDPEVLAAAALANTRGFWSSVRRRRPRARRRVPHRHRRADPVDAGGTGEAPRQPRGGDRVRGGPRDAPGARRRGPRDRTRDR